MEFSLTDKQQAVRRAVREFAGARLAPIAHELDQQARFPWELMDTMKAMGFFGLQASPAFGGAGLDTVSYCVTIEELSRACAAVGLTVSVHNSVALYPIEAFGNEEQKGRILPAMTSGERIGAFCLTEANAGSDVASIEATAVPEGDDYVLNANKIFVTNGALAGVAVVLARSEAREVKKGMSLFIVERGLRGFSVGSLEDLCGMRANPVCSLLMTDCRVPRQNLLGVPGEGVRMALETLDVGRIGIAAQAVGIAQASLDVSLEYALQRRQFRAPLAQFQTIQNFLADTATELEAARLLVRQSACLRDAKRPFSAASAMAKLYASELASRAASRGVQIHGGYGYSRSYPIERYYRDARVTEIYEGTSEMQRMVIARHLKERSKG
ncbi:MAG: acyl-CoA dehydrogenase family protein [bacterium]